MLKTLPINLLLYLIRKPDIVIYILNIILPFILTWKGKLLRSSFIQQQAPEKLPSVISSNVGEKRSEHKIQSQEQLSLREKKLIHRQFLRTLEQKLF